MLAECQSSKIDVSFFEKLASYSTNPLTQLIFGIIKQNTPPQIVKPDRQGCDAVIKSNCFPFHSTDASSAKFICQLKCKNSDKSAILTESKKDKKKNQKKGVGMKQFRQKCNLGRIKKASEETAGGTSWSSLAGGGAPGPPGPFRACVWETRMPYRRHCRGTAFPAVPAAEVGKRAGGLATAPGGMGHSPHVPMSGGGGDMQQSNAKKTQNM